MKKLSVFLAGLLLAGLTIVQAQTVRITGTVTSSEDGMPMPGVSVFVKGTTIGATTNADGKYELTVPTSAQTLAFSFVGYETLEVQIGGRSVIDASLKSTSVGIDEIVVVGYGIQYKRNVSGAIASVKGESIKAVPVQSFDQALQGKAAGVNITIPNGLLGNPPVIRVRGFNSISSSSYPLIVVDGVPVFTGDLSRNAAAINPLGDINPADIASIEVLKDASATAIYGSRAANGVILITTKKGSEGKTTVTYDVSYGFTTPYKTFEVLNAPQFVEVKNTARINAGLTPAYDLRDINGNIVTEGYVDTKWADYIYQTGQMQNHALTVSGGNKSTTYFLSVGYNKTDGMIKTNSYDRKNARLNLEHKVTNYLTLGSNVNYTRTFTTSPQSGSTPGANFATAGAARLAFVTAPIVPVYLANGDYNIDYPNNRVGLFGNGQPVGFFHPVFLFDNNYNYVTSDRLLSTFYANVNLYKGLFFRTSFGYDNNLVESKTFWHPLHGDGRTNNGEAYNYLDRRNRWNWTNTLNYNLTLLEKMDFAILLGSEEQYTNFDGWSGRRSGLADTFFDSYQGNFTTPQQPPSSLLSENYFVSYFSRFNFNFDKKYYFEASVRRDGFSGLAHGKQFGTFGGASVMWNITNEEFFKSLGLTELFTDLRIKASYGKVGNISGVSDFASLFLYSSGTYNGNPTLYFSQAGNANLGWETSKKFDAGIAFAMLKDRIQFEVNYYKNNIDGLILNVPQSPSKGIPGNVLPMNIGKMYNKGFEVTLTSHNFSTNDFKWTSTLTLSTLKNEVTELAPGVPFIVGVTQLETTNRTLVGYPIGNIWGVRTAGVDPQTGRRIFIRKNSDGSTTKVYYDHSQAPALRWQEADGTPSRAIDISNDGEVLGSPIPKVYGGLDNNLTYKNFDFSLGLTYAFGFYVYNGSKAGLRDQRFWNNSKEVYEEYWRTAGQVTDIPKPIWGDNVSNGSSMVQSQNVEKGDFVKIRNVSIGYTFRNELFSKAGLSSIRVYAQGFNLYTFTKYTGADPEISSMGDSNLAPGVDRNSVPQARSFTFGLNVTF